MNKLSVKQHIGEFAFTHTATDFSFYVFALQTVYVHQVTSIK